MNQQPTFQDPSSMNGASEELQNVCYVPYQPPNSALHHQQQHQPTMYPSWIGMNQIPFNYVNPLTSASVAQNDVELPEVLPTLDQQHLIPSSQQQIANNDTSLPSQETSPAAGRSCFWRWRNCKHSQQRRFLKSLKSKTWTRIPRAVGVFSLLFIILSIAFFLTIGKSADKHYLNYRKGRCQINIDEDNSIVHFNYEPGMYYLELNVSVAHRGLGPRGVDPHPHMNGEERMDQRISLPTMGANKPKRSFIMSRVCSYPLQQQTSDCRDRVIKQGEISCYIDEERMRLIEMMDMFLHFNDKPKKGPHPHGPGEKKPQKPTDEKQQQLKVHDDYHGRHKQMEDIVATRETVCRVFLRSLRYSIPGFFIVSIIGILIFIIVGFKVLDGKSRRSFDRFIRQYFENPFRASGEVYKLDEVSSSAVVIQDPKEPKFRTLLSASTLKMENTPHQERVLQKRLSKFWKLMRSTATKATESLLLYEKPAKQNISCHGKRNGACQGKRKLIHVLFVVAKVALIMIVTGLICYGIIQTGISLFKLKIFSGFLHLYLTLGIISLVLWFALFKRRSVHYMVTSERIVKVVELPIRLRMNLVSVSFDKIKSVWAEENRIYLKIVNSKGMERSGVIFEHVIDPAFVVNLIQQRIVVAETTEQQTESH